jgi:hypothetical protein
MKSATSGSQIGLLEVFCYLAAIAGVVGSVVSGWDFNLLIALIMLVIVYAILHDVRALRRLTTPDEPMPPSETRLLLQRSSGGGPSLQQPQRISGQQEGAGKTQDSAGWARAPQHTMQKGTTHESNGFRNA